MKKWYLIQLFCAAALSCLYSCHENKAVAPQANENAVAEKARDAINSAIKNGDSLLQDGDLVMRSDNDLESLALQNFSDSDRTYSHSGIAFKEDGHFMVYHSMTGSENPSGLCRKDPFDSFVSPLRKTGFGIFRYKLSAKEKETFHKLLQENIDRKMPFDIHFNLKTDDSLYCSEMIYKTLKVATGGRVVIPTTTISNFRPKILGFTFKNIFLKKFEYVSLDNLYLNPFCKEIIRVSY